MEYKDIEEIVKNYNTPIYVYDINKLRNRVQFIKNSMPNGVNLCYAIKANTFIIKQIDDIIDRFEVCSPGEYNICKKTGVTTKKLVISGVYKSEKSIENMIVDTPDIGHYTAESLEQFNLLNKLAIKYNKKLKILLRLTSGNQFGIDQKDIEKLIENRANYVNLEITGIQFFSGTQKHNLKRLQKEIDKIDQFVLYLNSQYGYKAKEIEFGTGFPVYYFQGQEFDEKTFFEEFSKMLNNMEFDGEKTLEVGRSIVASCGYYLTKVVDTKKNNGENYAIINGGIHQLVYYGQTMAMKHPHFKLYPERKGNAEKWNICGSLCTTNDILVKELPICDLKINDILVFENTGAYSVTEGIALFLSRDLPQVAFLMPDGKIQLVRKRFETCELNCPN